MRTKESKERVRATLSAEEALETSMIRSVAGLLAESRIDRRRPFRDPHQTATQATLIGGGTRAKPGEVSLAHSGVLFLDELPEFQHPALEELAAPEPARRKLLDEAATRLHLSARGYHRVLRVARTLADLAGAAIPARTHIAEALSYRRLVLAR